MGLLGYDFRSRAGGGRDVVSGHSRIPPAPRCGRSAGARDSRDWRHHAQLNHSAGRDFTVSDLRRQGFDAVLLAVGAHRSRDLSIPGVELDGVYKGIEFLPQCQPRLQIHHRQEGDRDRRRQCRHGRGPLGRPQVVRQHAGGVQDNEPSAENVTAVATKEMVDISLSALRRRAGSKSGVPRTSRPDAGRARRN